jgi:hypothetical protein
MLIAFSIPSPFVLFLRVRAKLCTAFKCYILNSGDIAAFDLNLDFR